jgi:phosphoserine phosphatase
MVEHHPKLVCFDLDGTVMVCPNSLQFLLHLNHAPPEILADIDRRETSREVHWVAADYERAPYLAGLPAAAIEESIDRELLTIGNLTLVLETLRSAGVLTVLLTSGPVEVAEAVARRFAFDVVLGSEFETSRESPPVYTGRIVRHLGSVGKLESLQRTCENLGLTVDDCVAVGDGESDIDLFRAVRTSIGLNPSPLVAGMVHYVVQGNDLSAILPIIL